MGALARIAAEDKEPERKSRRTTALDEPDAHLLSYDHASEYNGGSRWPYDHTITATHPERGEVGRVKYYTSGDRANAKIKIDKLEVDPDHRRRGYGSALMDQLQRQHPKSSIDHGDRTDAGKAWWSSYGEGKVDRRGRTAALEADAAAYAAFSTHLATSQYRNVSQLPDEHLDDGQRRALKRLKGEDDLIRGDRLTKLMREHGLHRHDSSPEDEDPEGHENLQWHAGRERFLDADHPLHTSQDYLHRPTLERLIRSPMLMVDKEDHFGPRIYRENHPEGRYWLQEGHHRTMADRMTQRSGWSYDLRETNKQRADRESRSKQARTAAADWKFEHHHVEGPHWRSFGDKPGGGSVMAEYKLRDGGVHFDTGTMHERQLQKHGPEAVQVLHDAVREHHGVEDAPPETAAPQPTRQKARVYFHGTTTADVTHILPAARHGQGVMFPSDTSHEHAYASLSKDDAWSYAEKAHYVTGGKPRVYQVRPLHGDHSHVEDDPQWENGRLRGNYERDRRSKVGFEVVRELKTPQHIHRSFDWPGKDDE